MALLLDRMLPTKVRAIYDAALPTADELFAMGRGYEALREMWAPGVTAPELIDTGTRGGALALATRS